MAPAVDPVPAEAMASLRCEVDAQAQTMACTSLEPAGSSQGIRADRIFGGQDRNVKVSSSGLSYDAGTQILSINVTVQNLSQQPLGTPDGSTVTGVSVFFFDGPNVTSGTGPVTVANPTSQAFFTAPNQDYFLFNEILQTNEISSPLQWQFSVPAVTTRFSFIVQIKAAQPNEALSFEDRVWDGSTSSAWTDGSNWQGGVAPDSASTVAVPADSLFAGSMPALSADAQLTNLRVGFASTLTLNSNTLTAWGNVDAVGSVTGGTVWMRGSGVLLGGNLPTVRVSGAASLQRATTTSGAVSVSDGSLVVNGSTPLSISIP